MDFSLILLLIIIEIKTNLQNIKIIIGVDPLMGNCCSQQWKIEILIDLINASIHVWNEESIIPTLAQNHKILLMKNRTRNQILGLKNNKIECKCNLVSFFSLAIQ